MASRSISDLHPQLAYAFGKAEAEWLLLYPTASKPFLTATFRSNEEQNALFDQPVKVTNAKAGQSHHNYNPALTFDIAFRSSKGGTDYAVKWFDLFAPLVLKTPGIVWGGHFKTLIDRPHFELADWKKLAKK